MSYIKENYSIKNHNSFGVNVYAKYFSSFSTEEELIEILENEICKTESILILGEGSNILFTRDFEGIILSNKIKGINVISEDNNNITIEVGAGEVWHDFVLWSIRKSLSGIENLALIPGLVGACPMQNIGAYGSEVKDVITKVSYIEIKSGLRKEFTNRECNFRYRHSIFKDELKDMTVITKVVFKLSKTPINNIKYGSIEDEIIRINQSPSPSSIAEAVINIRSRKLPDPKVLGNSGSFFKNPIVQSSKFKRLKKKFPDMVGYKMSEKETKIAAGWLIDNAGYKGYRKDDAGVHKHQALVLVNHGNASGMDILNLAKEIQKKIKDKYSITIENEVNIL